MIQDIRQRFAERTNALLPAYYRAERRWAYWCRKAESLTGKRKVAAQLVADRLADKVCDQASDLGDVAQEERNFFGAWEAGWY